MQVQKALIFAHMGFQGVLSQSSIFGAKSKNRVSEIQRLTDCQTLEKATLRQNLRQRQSGRRPPRGTNSSISPREGQDSGIKQGQTKPQVLVIPLATRLCAALQACGRDLPVASMADACGYTSRRPLARSRSPSPTLPSLLQCARAGRRRRRANGKY